MLESIVPKCHVLLNALRRMFYIQHTFRSSQGYTEGNETCHAQLNVLVDHVAGQDCSRCPLNALQWRPRETK